MLANLAHFMAPIARVKVLRESALSDFLILAHLSNAMLFLKPCVCCSQPTARIDESNSIQSLAFVILSGAHICNGVNFLERTIDLRGVTHSKADF